MRSSATMRVIAVLVPAVVLGLTACTSGGAVDGGTPSATASTAAASTAPVPSASAAPSSGPATARFGSSVPLADGLTVTATDEGRFTPSESASKAQAASYRRYRVTVRNGSGAPVSPATVYASLQDGDVSATPVIDAATKVGVAPTADLATGRSVSWDVGFGVGSGARVLQVGVTGAQQDVASFSAG